MFQTGVCPMVQQAEHIGIIAGSGQFPLLVARSAKEAGFSVIICGFSGHTDPALAHEADAFSMLRLGQFSKLISFFRVHSVKRLCLAGAIRKPKLVDLRPDLRAAKLIFSQRGQGDNSILHAVANELNGEGMQVVQAAELVPGLRSPSGVLTKRSPSADERETIIYGWPIGKSLGQYDIGQSIVLNKKMVVAVEALEGTDATIIRGGELGGPGCVLLKLLKPGQDTRADLPAMGRTTVENLIKYDYGCLAYEAGQSLFFDLEASITLADRNGLAIIGITPEDIC